MWQLVLGLALTLLALAVIVIAETVERREEEAGEQARRESAQLPLE